MVQITIKSESFEATVDRNMLLTADQTADGMSFIFKNGVQLLYSNQYMPNSMKERIKSSIDSFEGKP